MISSYYAWILSGAIFVLSEPGTPWAVGNPLAGHAYDFSGGGDGASCREGFTDDFTSIDPADTLYFSYSERGSMQFNSKPSNLTGSISAEVGSQIYSLQGGPHEKHHQ
jgi:hypothetical protein